MQSPSSDTYYIGLDLGTTSVKACAFNDAGKMVVENIEAYPLLHPEPGAAVQSPPRILASCGRALKKTVGETPGKIAGIGLSCPMHSVLLYHEETGWADQIYTWADGRGQEIMDLIPKGTRLELHHRTGTPVHPMAPLVKFRWLMEKRPEEVAAATHLYGYKELLTKSWTTETVLDEQLASATGLYDAVEGEWSEAALFTATGFSSTRFADTRFPLHLPDVKPANYQLTWKEEIAKELGVVGIPLFLGGSDGCLANLGSGITEAGDVAVTIGTSAAVRATHTKGRIDPAHQLFNYKMADNRFAIGGASNNGGKVMEYWQELLSGHFSDIGAFIDGAMSVKESDDLCYLPYLNGERAPIWDAAAASALTGLRGHHGPEHIARAVLDGVTDNVVTILNSLEAAVGTTKMIHASGGFTRSAEWVELLAEKSGRNVVVADTPQASAYGAALIAKNSLGES